MRPSRRGYKSWVTYAYEVAALTLYRRVDIAHCRLPNSPLVVGSEGLLKTWHVSLRFTPSEGGNNFMISRDFCFIFYVIDFATVLVIYLFGFLYDLDVKGVRAHQCFLTWPLPFRRYSTISMSSLTVREVSPELDREPARVLLRPLRGSLWISWYSSAYSLAKARSESILTPLNVISNISMN